MARINLVGIRRKRLKGDAWAYKRVCEEVLRLAQTSKVQHSSGVNKVAYGGHSIPRGGAIVMETNEIATQTEVTPG